MDTIILKGLEFQGRHGCYPEERKYHQRFVVDAILHLDLNLAALSDDLTKTVHYGEVYNIIQEIVTGDHMNLIEALAAKIMKAIFLYSPLIQKIKITLIKPTPPIEGKYDYFAVELERDREWLSHI